MDHGLQCGSMKMIVVVLHSLVVVTLLVLLLGSQIVAHSRWGKVINTVGAFIIHGRVFSLLVVCDLLICCFVIPLPLGQVERLKCWSHKSHAQWGEGGRQFYTNQYRGVCIPAVSGFHIFMCFFANRGLYAVCTRIRTGRYQCLWTSNFVV